jgi:pyrimidine operon attenuation protein/uracil phosphoribosyltransferase
VRRLVTPETALVGIWSGGAWLAERLSTDLGLATPHGVISSALHRDDFNSRGMSATKDATHLPFEVEGRRILLIDDVLYTGRTTRAVINELFDFGRPASVGLAVLVDRGGRELPIEPVLSAARISLPAGERVSLDRTGDGRFRFNFERV